MSSDFASVFIDTAPPSACTARFGVSWQQRLTRKVSLVVFFIIIISSHTNESTEDNLKFHSQQSSTGSPTIVYFELDQLSRRNGHNYAEGRQAPQKEGEEKSCVTRDGTSTNLTSRTNGMTTHTQTHMLYPLAQCSEG